MKTLIERKSTISIGALLSAALALLIVIILTVASAVTDAQTPDGARLGRLITIHDQGVEKVILTQAKTVGDAIKEAGITVDKNDFVEPGVNQELVASDYQVNIYRARPVIVVDGSIRQKIITPYQTAEQITSSAGITLYPEDITEIGQSNNLIDGASIQLKIKRATPFNFTLYGKTTIARTQAKTIGEMLKEKGIKLTSADRVSVDSNTKITSDLNVKVWREGKQVVTVDEAIKFDIERIENADKPVGYSAIRTTGIEGQRSVTYEIEVQDGQEVSRKEIASLTIKQPKKQVEEVGIMGQYTTPSENQRIAWSFLTGQGYNRVQTAGIMGNLQQENGFKTSGDGIAQWTGARKAALYSRPYPTNIYTQLGFLNDELNASGIGAAIKSTGSLYDAVIIFQNRFERCGACMESNRVQYAQNILASF